MKGTTVRGSVNGSDDWTAGDGIFSRVRVVDLTTGMAGPMASMMLADHGADVVKVEGPNGDWARALPAFVQWNRGKRSVVLDLADPDDSERARELVLSADVVLASSLDALLGHLGITETEVDERSPWLILCEVSGFGPVPAPTAGGRPIKGYEGIVAAATGRMSELDQLSGGQPGRRYDEPAFTAAPVASYGAAQLAAQGIVAALYQRQATGRGQRVNTSLVQGAASFIMRQELGRVAAGDGPLALSPAVHRGIELCFLTAECADGRYIQMCARQDKHFHDWLRAVGLGDVLQEPRYAKAPMGIPTVEDVDELEIRLREKMRTRTQAEWMRVFIEDYDVGADPFLTPAEFLNHPDMVLNNRVVDIVDPHLGVVRQLGPLVQMDATPAVIERSAPALGEHNAELAEPWGSPRLDLPTPTPVDDRVPPLTGVTILEAAYYIAGPLAGAILAEMGARVIKVEPLDGDPYRRTGLQSAKFLHGKESLTLDLKNPTGRAILDTLVGQADVVVHSFRAAAAARLGLDPASVLARNPRAVYLNAASYGSAGPQRDRAAFHSTPNALSGGGIKQAGRGNPPVNDSYADPGSALGAATALVFGLWARLRSGAGQSMETTMLASTGYIHSSDMVLYDGAPEWPIADHDQRGLSDGYRLYRTADGTIFVAAVQPEEWAALLGALGGDGPSEGMFQSRPTAHWLELLGAAGVGVAEAFTEPFDRWLEAHDQLIPMEHPGFGPYWRLPPRVTLSRSNPRFAPACSPGEQSCDLLAELGFDQQQIADMLESGVTTDGRLKPA
jgi:crotonobetainyl-CoA:carnitine CoA-transferase CaiB-like acyl-CoA transferase